MTPPLPRNEGIFENPEKFMKFARSFPVSLTFTPFDSLMIDNRKVSPERWTIFRIIGTPLRNIDMNSKQNIFPSPLLARGCSKEEKHDTIAHNLYTSINRERKIPVIGDT